MRRTSSRLGRTAGFAAGLILTACIALAAGRPACADLAPSGPAVVQPAETVQQWPSTESFQAEVNAKGHSPNDGRVRKDLAEAIALARRCLGEHLNGDRRRRPPLNDPGNVETTTEGPGTYPELYWGSDRLADGSGAFGPQRRRHALDTGVAHVVGRALWAMLLVEETLGEPPSPEHYNVLVRYQRDLYDNRDHIAAFIDPEAEFRRFIVCHDIREGFLGLLAMARVRNDAWAREELGLVVSTLEKMTDSDGRLSAAVAKQAGVEAPVLGAGNDATTSGRLVEPLLAYSRYSGDERAIRLAGRYARATLESTFTPEGRFREVESSGGHIHSITSSLCGITAYALAAGDAEMVAHCRRILDVGIPEYASSWGWVDEVMPRHPANEIGRGEINQTGDVIRTALVLGKAGHAEYYELAERFLRGSLLPVEHRQEDLERFLHEATEPKGDWQRDVPGRVVGGYSMFLPNDRMRPGVWPLTTQDIISGALHALCECWKHRCTSEPASRSVNLLFDYEDQELTVRSGLPWEGRISFVLRSEKDLLVRIPGWVDAATLRLTVGDKVQAITPDRGYVRITGAATPLCGRLEFSVPCKVEREVVDGTQYTTTWVGNQIMAIEPRGTVSPLPY